MGIKGLLPQLKNITTITNLKELREKKGIKCIGIDMSCLIHRAMCCAATDLILGKPTTR